ncbi:MAG: hypothetical protein FJ405_07675, partial [Verrucomicrobia bacterium]|nr:hypothetical protein [Verrucomicrobiota bacterium]
MMCKRSGRSLVVALLVLAGVITRSQAQFIITEFMAANSSTLADDDGDFEDWIEIHNNSTTNANLEAWILTDDSNDPTKWLFPALNVPGGGYVIVFASGKNRRLPPRPLHTNFRLGNSGEFLGLIKPGGTEIAHQYSPSFPAQADNVSFGLPQLGQVFSLVSTQATGRLLVPAGDQLGLSWVGREFGDTAWHPVTNALGYLVGSSNTLGPVSTLIRTRVESLLRNVNASAYTRFPFTLTNAAELGQLLLRIRYDDGFVAWLNGFQVAQRNAPVAAAGGVLADQAADWSPTGQQGYNSWLYGFYRKGADLDGTYHPSVDFITSDPQWSFNSAWSLGPGDPPWDFIGIGSWHPNGSNNSEAHWAIRRWISETAGTISCDIRFAKENVGCGNGVTLRVFLNGVQQMASTVAFNNAVGIQTNLVIQGVEMGDSVDFALDARGTNGTEEDGCDGSTFSVVISQAASPGLAWNSRAVVARDMTDVAGQLELDLSSHRDKLITGTNVLAIQGLNVTSVDNDFFLQPELLGGRVNLNLDQVAYFRAPTPGGPNNAGSTNLGPVILNVRHSPSVPQDSDDLIVTARVLRTLRAIGTVTLTYQAMFGTEVVVNMQDNGTSGDGAAGDGVYGARIPASATTPGQMIRYMITARDTSGNISKEPPFPDPARSPKYFGTVVVNPTLTNSRLPVLHWFIQNPGAADTDAGTRGALFFQGEFYDNVGFNVHGQSSRGFPKRSYDVDFNAGYKFKWKEGEPRVDDINLLSTWADKTHMRNILAHETFADNGSPAHFTFPVRVQQNGAFFSVANLVENGDDNFLRRLGMDPNGALYKMYNSAEDAGGGEKKTRRTEGSQDLSAFIAGMTQGSPAKETYMYDNMDLPEVVNFLANTTLIANTDCCHKNYYLYRDSDGTQEWQVFPWDVDLSFGRVWTCGTPCFAYYDETIYTNTALFVGVGNRVITPVFDHPATRQMYLRRLRTLMDTMLQAPGVASTNDFYRLKSLALRDQIAPDARLDLSKWGSWGATENITQAVNRVWNEFLPGRRLFLFQRQTVSGGGEIPASQPTNALIQITSHLDYRPASGNQDQEFLTLTNPGTAPVDISGWELEGGVRFQFKGGTVIPGRSALFVSPNTRAFRQRLVSPKGGERRLVTGPYAGRLSAWGETLLLIDTRGRLVSSNTFAPNPSLAQRQLRITEIMYNPKPAAAPVPDSQEFEYMELMNVGAGSIDLRGCRLTNGVEFVFDPSVPFVLGGNERVLLLRNLSAFRSRYGVSPRVAGEYVGSLDSNGETLRLEDSLGEKVLEFDYDNDWYPITDGLGFSLTMTNLSAHWDDWGNRSHWRPSGVIQGSPGTQDAPFQPAPILVNEVLIHTDPPALDSVELWNPTSAEVDI